MPGYPVDTVSNSQPWGDPGGLVRNPTGSDFVDLSADYADPTGGSRPVNNYDAEYSSFFEDTFTTLANWSAGSLVAGRNGNGLQLAGSSSASHFATAGQSANFWTLGFAYSQASLAAARTFLQLRTGASVNQLSMEITTAGAITVRLGGSGGAVITSSATGLITAGTFYFVEVASTLSAAAGTLEVRVNNTTVIGPLSGVNTVFTGTPTVWNELALASNSGGTGTFDDLYCWAGGFFGDGVPPRVALFAETGTGAVTFAGRGFAEVTTPGTSRIWPATSGPGTATSYTGNFIAGTVFRTTDGGFLDGYWWWVCGTGQATTAVKCALWRITAANTASLVSGSVVTSGTLTSGQWNYIPLSAPIQIPTGIPHIAAVGVNGAFPDTAGYWGAGQPGANGIANGIVRAYSAQGASDPENAYSTGQSVFTTGGTDPAVTCPFNVSATDNLWVDVQIDNVPVYTGFYRLWPTLTGATADANTVADASFNYVLATEILVYSACTVGKIWFYSMPGTAQLPTDVNIWAVDVAGLTGTSVYHGASPTWSGAAGSGWISTTLTGVTLAPGDYKISVYNNAGSPDAWSAKRLNYWGGTGAVAPNGITIGPIFAPPPSASAATSLSFGVPTPNQDGTTVTEPGQNTFKTGPPNGYPNQYVGNLSPGGNLYQNYWVDAEFTPLAGGVTTGGTGAIVFDGTGTATTTVTDTGSGAIVFAASGTATVTVVGVGSGAIVFGGSGTATTGSIGAGSGAIVFAGSGTATVVLLGVGAGAIVFGGAGTGTVTVTATGTGAVGFNGTGTSGALVNGTGTGAIVFAGSGSASAAIHATGTGAIVFAATGTATAGPPPPFTVAILTGTASASSTVSAGSQAAQTAQTGAVAAQNTSTPGGGP